MQYAVDYTDSKIFEVKDQTDRWRFDSYTKFDSWTEAKNSLIDYWQTCEFDAARNWKAAKKMKKP